MIPKNMRGELTAVRRGKLIELDFPATAPGPAKLAAEQISALGSALGVEPDVIAQSAFDLLVVVGSESIVRGLQPDFRRLGKLASRGVIVTSVSDAAAASSRSTVIAESTSSAFSSSPVAMTVQPVGTVSSTW